MEKKEELTIEERIEALTQEANQILTNIAKYEQAIFEGKMNVSKAQGMIEILQEQVKD